MRRPEFGNRIKVSRWLLGLSVLVLGGCSALPWYKPKQGALQVTSNGAFNVYLDENFLGQTPYFDEKIGVGNYVLRLVPSNDESAGIWQAQLQVAQRALTVVHYDWSGEPDTSSSEILELVPLSNEEAVELSLSTVPDSVVVKLDGEMKGFSPVVFESVAEGDHVLSLEAPGYQLKTMNLKTNRGHRLRVTVQLARDRALMLPIEQEESLPVATESAQEETGAEEEPAASPSPIASPSPTPGSQPSPSPSSSPASGFGAVVGGIISGATSVSQIKRPYIEVLDTGTGWLRVRSAPSGFEENEVAKIKVGTYFPFVLRGEGNEWVKLEYQEGKDGWVSGRFVRVVE